MRSIRGHHALNHAAVLGAVKAASLRPAAALAPRPARRFGALTAPARSASLHLRDGRNNGAEI
jgi:hypothetical protein